MKKTAFILTLLISASTLFGADYSLNGNWEYGLGRKYNCTGRVPGIVLDANNHHEESLWYRRELTLPDGEWSRASLELYGARFCPKVYINGELVSSANGGMTMTTHPLKHKDVRAGAKVTVEVELMPLKRLSSDDASFIPATDQWRSNLSSCLWDDVVLHTDNGARVEKIYPHYNVSQKIIELDIFVQGDAAKQAVIKVIDPNKGTLIEQKADVVQGRNAIKFSYVNRLKEWSPEEPNIYMLSVELLSDGKRVDVMKQNIGIKEFVHRDKKFYLNGKPCFVRGGTIVWHRWMRDVEGQDVGYDTLWFKDNVVNRIKEHGGNYLRFHLGVPPQRLLDLCDKYGLLVQYEWNFFHGMPATYESLMEQLPVWFDLSMRHPSISLYHPYNETEGDQLKTMWAALDKIVPQYPNIVLEDRDVLHIHKYWWSLFENLGLYYDSYKQFDRAIVVDEFGGNYLDGYGEMGGYTSLKESYLRFLGANSTSEMRLNHLAQSNGKVAEYWRRIGAAGVAPFTIASSWQDGNTWFMGKLREGRPKSVWNALTVAWAPVAASMDIWDRNFAPLAQVSIPVHLFNDTDKRRDVEMSLMVNNPFGKRYVLLRERYTLEPFSKQILTKQVTMPEHEGRYVIQAEVTGDVAQTKYPVISSWDIRVLTPRGSESVKSRKIYIPSYETELKEFALANSLTMCDMPKLSTMLLLSKQSWDRVAQGDTTMRAMIREAIEGGKSVVMLDVGERYLGQGYPSSAAELGPLQGVARVTNPMVTNYELFEGLSLTFTESAEPESHIHPAKDNNSLWAGMANDYNWLWNGLRGGLISPAADMEIYGMSPDAFVEQWRTRGADSQMFVAKEYYAYELYGFYLFSQKREDKELQKQLRAKVEFLVQDAPALAGSINIRTPIKVTDLAKEYRASKNGIAKSFTPLVVCGKNLLRTPVVMVDFGAGKGRLILSQLLTAQRLSPKSSCSGQYGARYDVCAVQMALNMIEQAK